MGALSVRYGTPYTSGNIAEAICKYLLYFKSIKIYFALPMIFFINSYIVWIRMYQQVLDVPYRY